MFQLKSRFHVQVRQSSAVKSMVECRHLIVVAHTRHLPPCAMQHPRSGPTVATHPQLCLCAGDFFRLAYSPQTEHHSCCAILPLY
jgi:hypothetical protein